MGANVKLAETMGQTTKVMGQMNKMVNPQQVAKTMQEFEMANAKMEMTEETSNTYIHFLNLIIKLIDCIIVNDALDDILAESGDEDEEQAVIDQVLDEIGIEKIAKVSEGPVHLLFHHVKLVKPERKQSTIKQNWAKLCKNVTVSAEGTLTATIPIF